MLVASLEARWMEDCGIEPAPKYALSKIHFITLGGEK